MKKPNFIHRLILCLSAVPCISVASTITSVTCSSPGAPFANVANTCSAVGTNGYASATSSAGVLLPANANEAATITVVSTGSALETTIRALSTTAIATSSANVGVIFGTTGPLRNGLLELSFDQTAWIAPVNGSLSEWLAVASYSGDPNGGNLNVWIPIQLGSDFGFDYQESLTAISSGLDTAEIGSQISLLAFEADGVTSVQLFDPPGPLSPSLFAPEPESIGLTLSGVVLGIAVLLKRRR